MSEKPVTKNQAKSNKNEFVALGNQAKALGIRPHVLRPTCEQYQKIADAGADGIVVMLSTIAMLTDTLVKRIMQRNEREGADKLVIAYGGAMHNDLAPRQGRELWSFGPSLREATKGGFVEIDLFVPEQIGDSESWKAFPWFPHYDVSKHGDGVALFRTGDHSYAMIFRATR